jgi:hypothetical protein
MPLPSSGRINLQIVQAYLKPSPLNLDCSFSASSDSPHIVGTCIAQSLAPRHLAVYLLQTLYSPTKILPKLTYLIAELCSNFE